MNENELPADIRRMISDAVRIVESERAGPMVPVPIPTEPDEERETFWDNLREFLASEGVTSNREVETSEQQSPSKSPTVNQRMAEMFQSDPSRFSWPASKWATSLDCTDAAVKQTHTWRLIMMARKVAKAERFESR